MQTLESAVTPLRGRHSRIDEDFSPSFVTHGSTYGQTRFHLGPEEGRRRRPYDYQRVMILDGGIQQQLAVLCLLKELMLVIIELEEEKDYNVESSSDSPLTRWSSTADGFRFCHYFDYICGMGGGGISAVLLGRLQCTVDDALITLQQILDEQSLTLLRGPRSPSTTARESFHLLRFFKGSSDSDSTSKSDAHVKKDLPTEGLMDRIDGSLEFESPFGMCKTLVITSQDNGTHTNAPYILRSYEILDPEGRDCRNPHERTHIIPLLDVCDAALASSSRPCTIDVPGINGSFHDASLKGHNARNEVDREIASLHSGSTEPFEYKLCNTVRFPGHQRSRSWFSVSGAKNVTEESLGDIFLDASHLVLPSLPWISKNESPGRIQTLMQEYCASDQVPKILGHWAEKMVAARKHRAGFERWETFAFGVHYKCCICEDEGHNSGFMNVDTWGSHVANEHKTPPFTVEDRCRVMS